MLLIFIYHFSILKIYRKRKGTAGNQKNKKI